MARQRNVEPLEVPGVATAAALPLYAALEHSGALKDPAAVAAVVFVALLGLALWMRGVEGRPLEAISITVMGAAYAGGTLCFAWLLRHHRFATSAAAGTALLLYPVVLTWASDIGAYFVGRWLGRAKLMPAISPGKTQAGAWGALVVTVGVSVAYNATALPQFGQLALAPWLAALFGVLVSLAAQVGDLVESMFKRSAGVKDSSHLLPGHGGILDRLDSLYFVLPVAYLLLGSLLRPAAP